MTRFEQSYRDIAAEVSIPGHDDPRVDILLLVSRWLNEERNGPWLIILDSADDREVFFGRPHHESGNANPGDPSRPVINFIPSALHGMILVTSRDRNVAYDIVGGFSTPIKVNASGVVQSLEVLKTKVPIGATEEKEALELVEGLDYIPLAITRAGAYIGQGQTERQFKSTSKCSTKTAAGIRHC
jgi:hypothetical protein